jgi:hypothetical protein
MQINLFRIIKANLLKKKKIFDLHSATPCTHIMTKWDPCLIQL